MWTPRLIALDIDGTTVAPDQTVPQPLLAAIQDALEAGVHVVMATGRGWHATAPVVDALGLPPGPHVCSNGAVLVSYPPLAIDAMETFDPASVIHLIARRHPDFLLATEVVGEGYLVNAPFPPGELGGRVDVVSLERLASEPVTRVIVRDPGASDDDFVDIAHELGLEGVSYAIGYTAWLDIAPEGIDKAFGLAKVAARLGVAQADVLALGDGRNDIEMLTWAGRGVALGDAPADVQAVADHVTGRFADGGTAAELRHWF